jgi:HAE1 family hydrophobic/amphiphilic exporter-1
MGISNSDLGYTANALVDGAYAGDYYLDGDKIDLGEHRFQFVLEKRKRVPKSYRIEQG